MEEKNNKSDFIKGKAICSSKTPIKKMKKQAKKKINTVHIHGKELVLIIYKELLQLNSKNTNNPMKSGPNTKTHQ